MSRERTVQQTPEARRSEEDAGEPVPSTRREPFSRTVAIVDAALRVWEAKNAHAFRSPWRRSPKKT
jgi:hypothetical protein